MPPQPVEPKRVLVSGSSGLIGRHLSALLGRQQVTVVPLVRTPAASGALLWSDVEGPQGPRLLSGFDAIVHLAGEPVGNGRWTAKKKHEILRSRAGSTRVLAEAAARAERPPHVFLCASGINAYGDRGDTLLDETASRGGGFLADVCAAWEGATEPLAGISRTVNMRIGIVLAADGGTLPTLLPLFRLGLGGPIGGGSAFVSWITLRDLLRAMQHLLGPSTLSGPVNLIAPLPVRNREFTAAIGKALHRPAVLPVPAWAVRLLFGQMAEETVLASVRAVPSRLLAEGFTFQDAAVEPALQEVLSTR